jgi:NAD(P)-dependent dehydrogenase (short-subunit alcohol dehydrogenase family)
MTTSRVWLVTGASSGLGLELVRFIASKGEKVIATSRSPDKLKGLGLDNGNVKAAYLDHNAPLSAVKASIDEILKIHGGIDVVVNNAAYVQTGMVEELTPEETQKQFQANVFGPINVYRAILPHNYAPEA